MFDIRECFTAVLATAVEDQELCNAAASELCQLVLQKGATSNRMGSGKKKMVLKARVTEAFTGTATTLSIKLEDDAVVTMDGAGLKQRMIIGPIPKARLTLGALIVNQAVPAGQYQEFIGVRAVGDNTFETTGRARIWFEEEADDDAGIDIA